MFNIPFLPVHTNTSKKAISIIYVGQGSWLSKYFRIENTFWWIPVFIQYPNLKTKCRKSVRCSCRLLTGTQRPGNVILYDLLIIPNIPKR